MEKKEKNTQAHAINTPPNNISPPSYGQDTSAGGVIEEVKEVFFRFERRIFSPETVALLLVAAFLFGVLSVVFVLAQTQPEFKTPQGTAGDVAGFVRDTNGTPLVGAAVRLKPEGLTTYTNYNGYYLFENVSAGEHEISISMPGYTTAVIRIYVDGQSSRLYDAVLSEGNGTVLQDLRPPRSPPSFIEMKYFLASVFAAGSVSALMGAICSWRREHFRRTLLFAVVGILSYGFLAGSILAGVAVFFLMGQKYAFGTEREEKGERRADTDTFTIPVSDQKLVCYLCNGEIEKGRGYIECGCGATYHLSCGLGKRCVVCGQEFVE